MSHRIGCETLFMRGSEMTCTDQILVPIINHFNGICVFYDYNVYIRVLTRGTKHGLSSEYKHKRHIPLELSNKFSSKQWNLCLYHLCLYSDVPAPQRDRQPNMNLETHNVIVCFIIVGSSFFLDNSKNILLMSISFSVRRRYPKRCLLSEYQH